MSRFSQPTNSTKDVNPKNGNYILIARVIHLWFFVDFKKTKFPFSMEMVIQDKEVKYFVLFFYCLVPKFILTSSIPDLLFFFLGSHNSCLC